MKELDVRHLACPGPVLALRDLLAEGETLIRLRVADNLARSNVTRFAQTRGADVDSTPDEGGGFSLEIAAASDSSTARSGEEALLVCDIPPVAGPTVIQVTSSVMGHGDDDLGALLLRSFLKTQMQLHTRPSAIIFYNDGVKLCCRGSLLIDDLRAMESDNIEILACGTCLNFFEMGDQLEVGRVTDMLEIASTLTEAGRLIRP
ncbi:MAG: sulfurtransferase-like selenium metabolism protein YedF, partial [Acidobacteriota bacterium]